MAKKAELAKPYYNNLKSYKKFRNIENADIVIS